jgi:acetyltransferase-like isoleucine patch superfamily enzyme
MLDENAYLETSHSFRWFRARAPEAIRIGRGASTYKGTMFDMGPGGRLMLGDYVLVNGAWIICDSEVTIGDHSLISWNVVIMDSYRLPFDFRERRRLLRKVPLSSGGRAVDTGCGARPVHIGRNVWIGFDVCVLPGVTIGEGSIVGARAVVTNDVAPYTVVAGNPARLIRRLDEMGSP